MSPPATARCARVRPGRAGDHESSTRAPSRPTACARTPAWGCRRGRRGQPGQVAGGGGDERTPAGRHPDLVEADAPVLPRHPPGSRPGQRLPGVAPAPATQRIGVAGGHHHGGRPQGDVAADVLGDVHTQERQFGVGHRVDHPVHPRPLGRLESEVGATERHDLRVARGAGPAGQPIGPQARHAMTLPARTGPSAVCTTAPSPASIPVTSVPNLTTAPRAVSSPPASGPPQGSRRCRYWVREVLAGQPHSARSRQSHSAPIRRRPGTAFAMPRASRSSRRGSSSARHGDDQLAAALVRDVVLFAVLVHQPRALDAQPGLQRAWLVVDSAVDHPGVVPGLVLRRTRLALQHRDRVLGKAQQPLPGHRQTDDARTDDDEVMIGTNHAAPQSMSTSVVVLDRPKHVCAPLFDGAAQLLQELRVLVHQVGHLVPADVHRGDFADGIGGSEHRLAGQSGLAEEGALLL